ncbi:SDR family NAD(P)-dependent oxidoreductase [Paenibacillus sp. GCM10023248]|uniref:SDR family NAD(P)-dependent oxidoreductase n=1 Tax=Bacillales TaxID=1385 RepID=UPI002378386D|nr:MULTISPECIES: SDR family NAD(P)-dependent oxidoreductase [Bacillales]MDD9268763.1 SDR family NAD(P)-dependent oxidoreductase [Paenibacillus sp. MAHUQ-63]MDR6882158.1 NAD(P)-dependent dehydrogenase (short-subunit alcohol dehydrogenase family) [Bacillus sp. 3255]
MLQGKSVCITGTDRGIGLAMTERLLGQGCIVYAGGIRGCHEELAKLAERYPDKLQAFRLDVGSDESVKEAAKFITSKTDRLDLLINNAAILGDTVKTVHDELDFDDIQRVYNVTAVGAIRVSNALIEPVMNGGKLIVNISSEAGSVGSSNREAWFGYCMAKAALNMGSTIIHNKIRKEGGRVLLIHPGWVKSYMSGEWNPAGTYTAEEAAAHIVSRIEEHGDQLRELPLYIEADTGNELPW